MSNGFYIADSVLADVEKLVADYLVLGQTKEENNNSVQSAETQLDGASLGRSVAQQLSAQGSVEVQPKNIDLLQKAAPRDSCNKVGHPVTTQTIHLYQQIPQRGCPTLLRDFVTPRGHQLALPRKQPYLNPNLTSSIPPSQERANQLDTAHKGDRSSSLQLDRIRKLQQQADLSADAACSRLEEFSQKLPPQLESIVEQLSIESKHLEPTHENTTARNPQQPKRYFSTDVGRSIANSLEASDERSQTDPSRDRLLQRSARKPGRPDRSPGAIKPHNQPILESGLNPNRQSSFLPIPASQSTQRNRLNSFTDESDRDIARKLKQIDRHHTATNTPTGATVERLGNFLADLTASNETAAAVGASSRPSSEDIREAVGNLSATPADLPSTPADLPSTPALTTLEPQQQLISAPDLEENHSDLEIEAAMTKQVTLQHEQLCPIADSIPALLENQASNNPAVDQNYQHKSANHRAAEPTATNLPTANENYPDFEDQTNSIKAIADQVRNLPLEDVALMLGLQPHRYDKHKWRKDGLVVLNRKG